LIETVNGRLYHYTHPVEKPREQKDMGTDFPIAPNGTAIVTINACPARISTDQVQIKKPLPKWGEG
jgi:hypothetical protein